MRATASRVVAIATTCQQQKTSSSSNKAPLKKSSGNLQRNRAIFNSENPEAAVTSKTSSPTTGEKKNLKVSLVGLGCPKNVVDAEVMLGDMAKNGYDITENHEDADAIIINSCGFIDDAKSESV